jgi:hypothetical protein
MHHEWLDAARNNGEIGARREAARSLVGNQASTATKHGGDARHCCFDICGLEH